LDKPKKWFFAATFILFLQPNYAKISYMITNINKVVKDIKSIKIQGATNIAKASIGALFDFSKGFSGSSFAVFAREAEKFSKQLSWVRPDEPLNQNLLALIIAKSKSDKGGNIKEKTANFQNYCSKALGLISKNEELITANGVRLIKKIYAKKKRTMNIFTHCNSSSVFKIIFGAHKSGIPVKVYDSETRPRYQGRIMAKNLAKNGIDVTMMTDSAAPFVISPNDPDKIDIDLVIIGADVIGMDGSVLNKIGSYSLALAAKNASVPFYAAASLLKMRKDIASYREIEIEKRDPTELWPFFSVSRRIRSGKQKSLKGVKAFNYAFDTVPPKYITGLITEFGILKPKDIKRAAKKNYEEIFRNKAF